MNGGGRGSVLPGLPESPRRHQSSLHLLTDVVGSSPHATQVGKEYKCSGSWLGREKRKKKKAEINVVPRG